MPSLALPQLRVMAKTVYSKAADNFTLYTSPVQDDSGQVALVLRWEDAVEVIK